MRKTWALLFSVAITVTPVVANAALTLYTNGSGSMEPTLHMGDALLVDQDAYRDAAPKRGDLIAFKFPLSKNAWIKRVVAVSGDRLSIAHGKVSVNGRVLAEPYVKERVAYDLRVDRYGIIVDGMQLDPEQAAIPARVRWTAPDRIPPRCYFVLGDNRNNSEDSHVFGFVCPGERTSLGTFKLLGKVISITRIP